MITTLLLGTMATMFGFDVKSVEELPDVSAKLWRMEYAKNGAELVWVDCPDENRTFVITFRTIPEDDTGVAHILEHAVLCGSEKFPSREPFVEMLKSSPHTYMNAYTAKDSTGYPVASRNEKDFLNLAEVYLDAVFHPNTVKSDWSMRQEGWHYEYDGRKLTRNGIVYSEMKGAMASPHTTMYHDALRLLFPDSVYRHNSGGLPAKIPNLTFDRYKAFHAKFYHPSNARIFLYGKIDTARTLPLVASALEPFERRTEKVEIPLQERAVFAEESHPYASSEEKDRTLLCDGWVVGRFDEYEKLMALNLLSEYLAGNNFSPLKAPFLKAGLCEDVGMGVITDQQLTLLVNYQNVKDGEADACRRLFDETVRRLIAEGFDAKRLLQLLDKHEFKWRERDTSDRGMNVYHAVMDSWLYGGDPAQNLRATAVFKSLRDKVGTGWYENLLKAATVDNRHACRLTLTPSRTLAAENEAADALELQNLQEKMSADELAAIAEAAADLKRRHATPEDPAILAKLPKLTLADMPVDCEILGRTVETNAGVTVIRPAMDLKGFFYLDLAFSLAGLTREELLDTTLLTDLFGELGSVSRTAEELKGEMDGTFGSFSVDVASYEKGPQLVVRLAALDSHRAAALDLAEEVLLKTDFSDATAIETQRQQNRVWMEDSTRGRKALEFAGRRAAHGLSAAENLAELFKGIDQIRHLQTAKVGDLAALAKKVFTRENLTVVVAGDVPETFVGDVAARFPNTVPPAVLGRGVDKPAVTTPRPGTARGTAEGFAIDGNIAFAALAAKLPDDVAYSGVQQVAGKIISLEHLWPELRVKGGAYGAFFSIGANRTLTFRSYRDPNPKRAYEEYAKAGEKLAAFVNSGASFEKYQVSTLELTDPNFSPREKMAYVRSQYFNGRDPELPRRMRREILKTTKADLLAFAETLRKVVPTASRCALGGKDLLAPCGFATTASILVPKAHEPSHTTLIAHRGESVDAPENTMPAYRTAVARGFGFECDIYLSKDGRCFTFHDRDLTRTTAGANTNRCADVTWDEVAKLDVGGWGKWKDSKFTGTRPALLEELLELARPERKIYVELKTGPEIVPFVKKVFEASPKATPESVLFIAFSPETCAALKRTLPEYAVYLLLGTRKSWETTAAVWTADEVVAHLQSLGVDGVDICFDPTVHDAAFVKAVHDAGFSFHVWTVDDPDLMRKAFAAGVDTLTTNCAQKLLEAHAGAGR